MTKHVASSTFMNPRKSQVHHAFPYLMRKKLFFCHKYKTFNTFCKPDLFKKKDSNKPSAQSLVCFELKKGSIEWIVLPELH